MGSVTQRLRQTHRMMPTASAEPTRTRTLPNRARLHRSSASRRSTRSSRSWSTYCAVSARAAAKSSAPRAWSTARTRPGPCASVVAMAGSAASETQARTEDSAWVSVPASSSSRPRRSTSAASGTTPSASTPTARV
ncbi:Uncharacterised protein [Mycobacteroides abscessus]|nr:Uncharacterised protein [Mycobacteroides abscessus]